MCVSWHVTANVNNPTTRFEYKCAIPGGRSTQFPRGEGAPKYNASNGFPVSEHHLGTEGALCFSYMERVGGVLSVLLPIVRTAMSRS